MVLDDGTVTVVEQYTHKKKETAEEVIEQAIKEEKRYFKLLGIKKGFYIGIPTEENEKTVVVEM